MYNKNPYSVFIATCKFIYTSNIRSNLEIFKQYLLGTVLSEKNTIVRHIYIGIGKHWQWRHQVVAFVTDQSHTDFKNITNN